MTDDSDDVENDQRYLQKAAIAQTPDRDPRDTGDSTQVEGE